MGLARSNAIADKDVGGGEGGGKCRFKDATTVTTRKTVEQERMFQRFNNFPVSQPYFYVPLLLSVNIFIINFIT